MPKPRFEGVEDSPLIMNDEEIKTLAEQIENLVREQCPKSERCGGVGSALMLAAHHLLGWNKLQGLLRGLLRD